MKSSVFSEAAARSQFTVQDFTNRADPGRIGLKLDSTYMLSLCCVHVIYRMPSDWLILSGLVPYSQGALLNVMATTPDPDGSFIKYVMLTLP